jgi:peptidoglycan/xylan/chitin deacetylase (PgdA/CDA1 family)
LRRHGVTLTIFIVGQDAALDKNRDALGQLAAAGHEIGNHSLTHPLFSRIGLDGAAAELEQTERIVMETTGASTRPYFLFPYGDSTPDTAAIVAREGYVAYHWSAADTAISSWIGAAAANPAAGYGSILLMHGHQSTVAALPGWLDQLAAIGLRPTTLGEVLR